MSRQRLSTTAVLLALVGVFALPPTGSTDRGPDAAGDVELVMFAQGGEQEGFTLDDFTKEFERRIPEPGNATPTQIKRAARQTANQFESDADRRIKIRIEYECCPSKITITVSW